MLACVDVSYHAQQAHAACLVFADWSAAAATETLTATTPVPADYAPGELYRRELPPLVAVLARVTTPLSVILVDGYVWLAGHGRGVGAHLYEALSERVAIVGVAKTAWTRAPSPDEPRARRVVPVRRGGSARPLFVTSAGLDPDLAAEHVRRMHGAHRLPTLLKAVDSLARGR